MNNRIKELRKQKNISQKKLSEMIGYSQSVISDWENCNAEPTTSAVSALANCFGCSIDYLVGRENEEGNIVFSDSVLQLSDLESELIKVFRSLPDKYKHQALGLMQGFAHSIRL